MPRAPQLLLLPFRASQFARLSTGGAPALPVADENAPDLYIPSMAFITYVLSMGLNKGMLKEFHPDVLVVACTSTLATHALEVVGLWATTYFLVPDLALSLVRKEPGARARARPRALARLPPAQTPAPLSPRLRSSISLPTRATCTCRWWSTAS